MNEYHKQNGDNADESWGKWKENRRDEILIQNLKTKPKWDKIYYNWTGNWNAHLHLEEVDTVIKPYLVHMVT